ncbi:MAK16, protein MAK16 [Babesia microti strain RI]|uniref:Protein MAK16 homolog n=1 Tax=Babesia microti (strain RI) TaxID=1133968 RepID=I7J656_BABMR|nr:MAK16, protein MAK16 [Babesia microti strain RI]CCF73497.1 MAK16, protein MAK16 [Babesia microti strain RI]|eukprot:XP_012648106.1 MAK16, protein MAK16 [Babesia microti strain RI]
MADGVIWQLVKNGFCTYRLSSDTVNFCSNKYNATGLCNKSSCPLSNSNYSTVIEDIGNLYLCLKTVERSHTPVKQWQRIKLSNDLKEAIDEINEHTKVGYPAYQTSRCKSRLKRLREVIKRSRDIAKTKRSVTVPIKKKTERREAIRETKATKAAVIDVNIEQELLKRLHQGTYGSLYNFEEQEIIPQKNIEMVDNDIASLAKSRISTRCSRSNLIEYEDIIEN